MNNDTKALLISYIQEQFSANSIPADNQIVVDNYRKFLTIERIRILLTGTRWLDLLPEQIWDIRLDIYFLTAHAFYYYMPAFMTFMLNDRDHGDIMYHTFARNLTLVYDNPKHNSRLEYIISYLTSEQKKIVVTFFEYAQQNWLDPWDLEDENHPVNLAYKYWRSIIPMNE